MRGHEHTVARWGALSIEQEHEAWRASGEPCLFCGTVYDEKREEEGR